MVPEKVLKKNGLLASFNELCIKESILLSWELKDGDVNEKVPWLKEQVVDYLSKHCDSKIVSSAVIEDALESVFIQNRCLNSAKSYIASRMKKDKVAEEKHDLMEGVKDILIETSRENANIGNSPTAKIMQIATAASKVYYLNYIIPENIAEAHKFGHIHIHDLDFYCKTLNCLQIDLDIVLNKGFNTPYGFIPPPNSFSDAVTLAVIAMQNNQNDMYGGQSFPHFDKSMGDFIRSKCPNTTEDEIHASLRSLILSLNTVQSRGGAQVPFSSLNFGTDTSDAGRMVSKNLLSAYDSGMGKGETPIFPNLIFRLKKGVNFESSDPNYDLFQQAMSISAKRMNPTYSFMDSSFNRKYGDETSYMGCRSRVMANRNGKEVAASRGNIAPVTINLPGLALRNRNGSVEDFFAELDKLLELCREQLLHRYEVLSQMKVKEFPFLMRQKLYLDSDDLSDDDEIAEAIKNGTLALGFIGLAEAVKVLTGEHHGESKASWELAYKIVDKIKTAADDFSEAHGLNFAAYGTPAEGLSGRFTVCDRKAFGIIEGITDKDYYSNSFHVPVDHNMSMYDKMNAEGPFHKLCQAGHISYVELASAPSNNIPAVEKILRCMSEADIGYAGINFPIDECLDCGHSGLLDHSCPACDSDNIRRIRRITGYLSTIDRFNYGKKAELNDRVEHS